MAKTYVVKLEVDGITESVNSINSLETAVSDLENELKNADLGSAEFKQLSEELGVAKGELGGFQRGIDALDPAAKAEQFVKFGEGIAGGFAVATGAMSLMGTESEEMEKLMVNAQGAVAIAVGIRSIAEANLSKTIANTAIAEQARAAATAVSTFVTGAATTGLKLFRLALVSTGIGAIVVLVGLLVANFDKVKKSVTVFAEYLVNFVIGYFNLYIKAINLVIEALNKIPGVSIGTIDTLGSVSFATEDATDKTLDYVAALGKLRDAQSEATRASQSHIAQLERELKLKTAQGAKESELLKLRREIIEAKEMEAKVDLKAIGEQILMPEADGLKEKIAGLMKAGDKTEDEVRGDLGLPTEDEMNQAYRDALKDKEDRENDLAVFDAKTATDKRDKKNAQSKKNQDITDQETQKTKDKAAADLITEAEQLKALEDEMFLVRINDENKRAEAEIEQQRERDLEAIEGAKNFAEQELLINKKYDNLASELKKEKLRTEAEQLRALTEELALMAIDEDYERAQKELELQEQRDLEAIEDADNYEAQKLAIEQKYTNLSKDLKEEKAKSDIEIAQSVADAEDAIDAARINNIGNGFKLLSQAAGENRAAQAIAIIGENAVGIAKQIISTKAANTAIIAQGAALAIPSGGASKVAAAALVTSNNIGLGLGIAGSVLATKKALSSLKAGGDAGDGGAAEGGGDAGGGGGGGGAPDLGSPEQGANIDFSFLGQGDTSQVGQAAPVQAYVLESDVSSSQEASQIIQDQSTL